MLELIQPHPVRPLQRGQMFHLRAESGKERVTRIGSINVGLVQELPVEVLSCQYHEQRIPWFLDHVEELIAADLVALLVLLRLLVRVQGVGQFCELIASLELELFVHSVLEFADDFLQRIFVSCLDLLFRRIKAARSSLHHVLHETARFLTGSRTFFAHDDVLN